MRVTVAFPALCFSLTAASRTGFNPSDGVQAGYHVIWSYPGPTIPQDIYSAAIAGRLGGIILFGENVNDNLPTQINALQQTYKKSKNYPGFPLLILTDQEGGEVNRLPGGPTQSAKEVGQASDPAAAAASAGSTVATVFSEYNVNGDLAPVLGVFRESGDFLDRYERSYGNTCQLVSTCVGPFISAMQSKGVLATAKHFPGLGAAARDANTDVEPVTLNLTLNEIRSIDEVPYKTAISTGVKMVMPSWALYPALDSKYPSGLSKRWIRQELRGRLGFRGVTISDAIEAGALTAFGDTGERTTLALSAGMDVILAAARNTTQGSNAVTAIVSGLKSGQIDLRAFKESTKRIADLRKSLAGKH
ncbi:glycoside hydrolase family 3 protein [Zasmidium cellare ATCC 36951]|uniref:Glycoside hydrolase family 3 protein n=1 Tax=Zasmidium cellare ATCC 36951 TaxID=1080233 RepID=A0A6A6C2H2_ZASCE|nr:glycoside hydrolase family 3 protein [Zasmidium cellare ATCC 36951]KAF2160380.1 glycoside hydrolase family 3 protein [Zasmidium cellare ATCC 36951]